VHHGFALGGDSLPGFTAGVGLFIERPGDRRGTADAAELKDFDLKVATFRSNLQNVPRVNLARGLHRLPPRLDPS